MIHIPHHIRDRIALLSPKDILGERKQAKEMLMETHHIGERTKDPMVIHVLLDHDDSEMLTLLSQLGEGMYSSGLSFLPFLSLPSPVKGAKKKISSFIDASSCTSEIWMGTDVFVFLPCKDAQWEREMLVEVQESGGIPLLFRFGRDVMHTEYDAKTEKGSVFYYDMKNPWSIFAQIVRIHEIYHFPYDWNTVRKRAIQSHTRTLDSTLLSPSYAYLS